MEERIPRSWRTRRHSWLLNIIVYTVCVFLASTFVVGLCTIEIVGARKFPTNVSSTVCHGQRGKCTLARVRVASIYMTGVNAKDASLSDDDGTVHRGAQLRLSDTLWWKTLHSTGMPGVVLHDGVEHGSRCMGHDAWVEHSEQRTLSWWKECMTPLRFPRRTRRHSGLTVLQ